MGVHDSPFQDTSRHLPEPLKIDAKWICGIPGSRNRFSTSAARAWAHEGPFLAAEYAIEEFQLLAAGAILDLYDAAVEAQDFG